MNNKYETGIGHVGAYQVSGIPFITGSDLGASPSNINIQFPSITKSITINVTGSDAVELAFASPVDPTVRSNKHTFVIASGDSLTYDVKCKEVWLIANNGNTGFQLLAELTNISPNRMWDISSSVGISG